VRYIHAFLAHTFQHNRELEQYWINIQAIWRLLKLYGVVDGGRVAVEETAVGYSYFTLGTEYTVGTQYGIRSTFPWPAAGVEVGPQRHPEAQGTIREGEEWEVLNRLFKPMG